MSDEPDMPSFALQKVTFRTLKGRVLHCKRWRFATCWISMRCAARGACYSVIVYAG